MKAYRFGLHHLVQKFNSDKKKGFQYIYGFAFHQQVALSYIVLSNDVTEAGKQSKSQS